MFRSLHVAATGMVAQETNLDTISNNLANSNTTGYKRQESQFEDLIYQTVRPAGPGNGVGAPAGVQLGSGARVVATSRQFSQGAIHQTDNPLDVAIEGAGFLAVNRVNGDVAYTRAGALRLDSQGRLVNVEGLPLEPAINVPIDSTNVVIGADGSVSATQSGQHVPTQLGQIQLVTFPNPAGLQAVGHNLFTVTGASGDPTVGTPGQNGLGSLMQGSLEQSNVEVVQEMIGLIRTQRAYEVNSKVVQAADEMLRNATQMR